MGNWSGGNAVAEIGSARMRGRTVTSDAESSSPSEPASAPAPDRQEQHRARWPRWLVWCCWALVGFVLPTVMLSALVGALGVSAFSVGLILGLVGSRLAGTRRMVVVAPLLGVAGGIGAYTAYDWGWAALLAVTGLVAGAGYAFGWFAALLMITFAATFTSPVSTAGDAVIYAAILAISTLYGVIGSRRMHVPPTVEGRRISAREACVVAVLFGAVLGGAAAIGVALGWTEPYWVPEPVLVLVLYVMIGKRDRIRGKAIGTAVGAAAALPIAVIDPPAAVLTLVGIVALLLAFTQTKIYWLMYGLYTFAVVLLLAAPGQVAFEAEERGLQILLGVGLLVLGLVLLEAMRTWLREKDSSLPPAPA